ncbi:MAG: asparagine synthase (glutamine-hydrolyzing) [Cytophagales bacterium]
MCGIAGILAFDQSGINFFDKLSGALQKLHLRGPDVQQIYTKDNISVGHARLSILDVSHEANQPFLDETGRYVIVYNGEVFNYKELQQKYISEINHKTHSDTEVLLNLLIKKGTQILPELEGFFSLCFIDLHQKKATLVRDRFGKKPLVYSFDNHKLIFASEIKALEHIGFDSKLNTTVIYEYFKYAYNPVSNASIYKNVKKIAPGCFIEVDISKGQITKEQKWYEPAKPQNHFSTYTYNDAQEEFKNILDEAVKKRLISDVPLGAFLSGGIDSSIVVALASKYVSKLKTFSVAFTDEPFLDENIYAQLVARMYDTNHTTIHLNSNILKDNIENVLEYIDEPFADSSALAVYVLSKETRKHVTVALSGDGADEVFAGYNKYVGELKLQNTPYLYKMLPLFKGLLKTLPSARTGTFGNTVRQINKFIEGVNLSPNERYLRFCSIHTHEQLNKLFTDEFNNNLSFIQVQNIERILGGNSYPINSLNDVLWLDQQLVLPQDMMVKVDLMSMANSLEVRSPFMDHKVIEFANQLPLDYKIDSQMRKKIVQDAFREQLPPELYNRPKKGFDVPMLPWFKNELHEFLFDDLLGESHIKEQNIFNYAYIKELKDRLNGKDQGDLQATLWSLMVFQYWYKKRKANLYL